MEHSNAFRLVLGAVLAICAITASTAAANQFHFTSTKSTITRSANANQVYQYETSGQSVICTTLGGSGSATAQTVAEFVFHPTYSGCSVPGIAFSSAEIQMHECSFLFTIQEVSNTGTIHIQACNAGKQITITVKVFGVSVCTYHVGEQTPANVDHISNSGTQKVTIQPTQSEIIGTREGSSECGAASSKTGSYSGQVEFKAEETGTQNEKAFQVG